MWRGGATCQEGSGQTPQHGRVGPAGVQALGRETSVGAEAVLKGSGPRKPLTGDDCPLAVARIGPGPHPPPQSWGVASLS